jgi:serine/threonine protein kinase
MPLGISLSSSWRPIVPKTKSSDPYPDIVLSGTDREIAAEFSNGFEKYQNFRPIGGGGNGLLIACYDSNLGRHVVLKRLADEVAHDPRERRRLLREARVTAQLQHPNTVPVYELGTDDKGNLYFSMKKIEGENLFRILGRIAQKHQDTVEGFPLDRLLGIIVQACNALAYAHAHGVIHRDVKPENIMVGLFNEVLLMDWGVAKVWGKPDEFGSSGTKPPAQRLTAIGQRPGTPLYMSPEQVRNERQIDERTDVFSMGVVLYELLALREPFRGRSVRETFENIVSAPPVPPSEIARHFNFDRRLDDVCLKAMNKKPADRFQSMHSMIEAIRNAYP